MARGSKKIEEEIAERIKTLSLEELVQVRDFAKKLLELEKAKAKRKAKKGQSTRLGKVRQSKTVRGKQGSL